jgi:hypothetical protein
MRFKPHFKGGEDMRKAFEAFLDSADLEAAFMSSTKAAWGGGSYSVELFPDGEFRILPSGSIGNKYVSPGGILKIPPLTEDEYDEESGEVYIDNAVDLLRHAFEEWETDEEK